MSIQRICTAIIFILFSSFLTAQVGVGEWRDHFPYLKTVAVASHPPLVFCATPYAIFTFNKEDDSIERYNKSNKLSDTDISTIAFHKATKTLLVGYENGNLDFISGNASYNLADIKNSGLIGNKTIRKIHFVGNKAFLATGFGIVKVDMEKTEISSTYFIGENGAQVDVYDLVDKDGLFYAVCDDGIRTADVNDPFLANFASWSMMSEIPDAEGVLHKLEFFHDNAFLMEENDTLDILWHRPPGMDEWLPFEDFNEVNLWNIYTSENEMIISKDEFFGFYNQDLILQESYNNIFWADLEPNGIDKDNDGDYWIAANNGGLLGIGANGEEHLKLPQGPPHANVRRIDTYNNNLWIASGGVDPTWTNNYDILGIYGFVDESWEKAERLNGTFTGTDYMAVSINPRDNKEVFLGNWYQGLVRMYDGKMTHLYDETNSSLTLNNFGGSERIGVGGVDHDEEGNLWFSSTYSDTPLHVRTTNGNFTSYSFEPDVSENTLVGDVLVSRQGYVYAILPRGGGILVFDNNGTITQKSDDNYKVLTSEEGHGGLPTTDVYSIEEDLYGEIWIGTLQGLAVIYTPQSIFSGEPFDAQQILIEQDGNIQILLETETITAITIDGANRKWVGTQNAGAYLLSDDGLETIEHFTTENSPLPSNTIEDIAINHETGEVHFATINGLMSYRGDATNFDPEMSAVSVFPNPVRPDFDGPITIDGLAMECDVKITDIQGNVVYQMESLGGRATWDGKNFNGEQVVSGVYLVFSTTKDGKATAVAKIAFVK